MNLSVWMFWWEELRLVAIAVTSLLVLQVFVFSLLPLPGKLCTKVLSTLLIGLEPEAYHSLISKELEVKLHVIVQIL